MAENSTGPVDGTQYSLLERLCSPSPPSSDDWERFVQFYAPLLHLWAMRQGFQDSDAADLAQDVLVKLMQRLKSFQRNPGERFRDWLFVVMRNQCLDFLRHRERRPDIRGEVLGEVEETWVPQAFEEAEYRRVLLGRLMELVKGDFEKKTWAAFVAVALEGKKPSEVAPELGMTANAVSVARNRVLTRLRTEAEGLLD